MDDVGNRSAAVTLKEKNIKKGKKKGDVLGVAHTNEPRGARQKLVV